jgi:rubrerythrin
MTTHDEGLTSLEALGVAIRAETDTHNVFAELARRCERPIICRRFEQLAAEQSQHLTYLMERWEQVSGGVPLRLPPSRLPTGMDTSEERQAQTVEDVLDVAIDAVRHDRDFYIRAARETDDSSGQRMFQYLADMAFRQMNQLTEERDLLIRYPRYHGATSEPWQPERSLGSSE